MDKISEHTIWVFAEITHGFARLCYDHDFGCVQSIRSRFVMPVFESNSLIPNHIVRQQGEINSLICHARKAVGYGNK